MIEEKGFCDKKVSVRKEIPTTDFVVVGIFASVGFCKACQGNIHFGYSVPGWEIYGSALR